MLFTVWVDGVEVNDHYVGEQTAKNLARMFLDEGYDRVVIEKVMDLRANAVMKCFECGRLFDLRDEETAMEWSFGHDCEVS